VYMHANTNVSITVTFSVSETNILCHYGRLNIPLKDSNALILTDTIIPQNFMEFHKLCRKNGKICRDDDMAV